MQFTWKVQYFNTSNYYCLHHTYLHLLCDLCREDWHRIAKDFLDVSRTRLYSSICPWQGALSAGNSRTSIPNYSLTFKTPSDRTGLPQEWYFSLELKHFAATQPKVMCPSNNCVVTSMYCKNATHLPSTSELALCHMKRVPKHSIPLIRCPSFPQS